MAIFGRLVAVSAVLLCVPAHAECPPEKRHSAARLELEREAAAATPVARLAAAMLVRDFPRDLALAGFCRERARRLADRDCDAYPDYEINRVGAALVKAPGVPRVDLVRCDAPIVRALACAEPCDGDAYVAAAVAEALALATFRPGSRTRSPWKTALARSTAQERGEAEALAHRAHELWSR